MREEKTITRNRCKACFAVTRARETASSSPNMSQLQSSVRRPLCYILLQYVQLFIDSPDRLLCRDHKIVASLLSHRGKPFNGSWRMVDPMVQPVHSALWYLVMLIVSWRTVPSVCLSLIILRLRVLWLFSSDYVEPIGFGKWAKTYNAQVLVSMFKCECVLWSHNQIILIY